MAIAAGLVGSEDRSIASFGSRVPSSLAKTAMTEFVGAPEKFNRVVSIIGRERRLHGAIVLVTKGQDVCPHAK
jgi:hypothetical protein